MIIAPHHLEEPEETRYKPNYDWPRGCEVQWGDLAKRGLKKHYPDQKMAFFEAFPLTPDTYLRGEGHSILEAEEECYRRWEKILNCKKHVYPEQKEPISYWKCSNCGLLLFNWGKGE